ncbi:MAG: RNA polymerase sigma factor [Verrucomicrobiales bacterium]|nr:RNA polymerase sigma factor [Verrucomicrobiales bacterium]
MDTSELRAQLSELHPLSFGWARNCCRGDADSAADVLQSAYEKILSGRAVFREKSTFKTWLFGVILNSAREDRRRKILGRIGIFRYQSQKPTALSDPGTDLEAAESNARIRRLVADLSRRQQEILHLVFYQDLTIEEAAGVMGVTIGSARTHYHRAKKNLRKKLEADTENE